MVSTESVAAAMGAGKYAQALEEACIRFGIVPAREKAHFLAHMAVESQRFTRAPAGKTSRIQATSVEQLLCLSSRV